MLVIALTRRLVLSLRFGMFSVEEVISERIYECVDDFISVVCDDV